MSCFLLTFQLKYIKRFTLRKGALFLVKLKRNNLL